MNNRFRRSLVFSTALHVFVFLAVIVLPLIAHVFHREKPRNILMVDLMNALPPLPVPPQPAPVIEEKIKPPEPPKPEILQKSKIHISTNLVKRAAVQPKQTAKKPPLTAEEIRKILNAGIPQGGSAASVGEVDAMSWYYALVQATMYEAWDPPSEAAQAGLVANVVIRVLRDGTITQRSLSKSSGNDMMDASVMKAVQSVARLKPLPPEYGDAYKDITITFQPTASSVL